MKLSYCDQSNRIQSMIKTRQDNDVINCIVWSTPKLKLNCWDLSNRVRSMMKTRQDNNVIDRTGAIYIEKETKWS